MRLLLLAPLLALSLASPINLDLDPRDVNPPPELPLAPPRPHLAGAVTVFTVSMASDSRCNQANQMLFGAYNSSSTGCRGTRGPAFGSLELVIAVENPVRRLCTAHIYETASCEHEVGVGEAQGAGEGVCVYPGLGLRASGWSVECTEGLEGF